MLANYFCKFIENLNMKDKFVSALTALINEDDLQMMLALKIILTDVISEMKIVGETPEFRQTFTAYILGDVNLYIDNPTNTNRGLLKYHLLSVSMIED